MMDNIRDDIIYANVLYPNDVKEVYQKAKDNFLKGYSATSSDGRHFKWNYRLSKAETINDDIVYLNEDVKAAVTSTTIDTNKENSVDKKLSDNVSLVKDKITALKNQVTALSSTVANLTSESKTKDEKIKSLQDENKDLKEKIKSLESDIAEIVNL